MSLETNKFESFSYGLQHLQLFVFSYSSNIFTVTLEKLVFSVNILNFQVFPFSQPITMYIYSEPKLQVQSIDDSFICQK